MCDTGRWDQVWCAPRLTDGSGFQVSWLSDVVRIKSLSVLGVDGGEVRSEGADLDDEP